MSKWTKLVVQFGMTIICGYGMYSVGFKSGYTIPLIGLLYLTWFVDIGNIKAVEYAQGKFRIEAKQTLAETKEAAKQVLVTADWFDNLVDAYSKFSLDSLQIQGRLDATVSWHVAADFVTQARIMINESGRSSGGIQKVAEAEQKVLSLFRSDMSQTYPEISEAIQAAVHTSDYVSDGHIAYSAIDSGHVDFDLLYAQAEKLKGQRASLWRGEVDDLKEFCDNRIK